MQFKSALLVLEKEFTNSQHYTNANPTVVIPIVSWFKVYLASKPCKLDVVMQNVSNSQFATIDFLVFSWG